MKVKTKRVGPTIVPTHSSKLQHVDGVVQSVFDCRKAYHNLTDREFAGWYESKYKIKAARVLSILANGTKQTLGGA